MALHPKRFDGIRAGTICLRLRDRHLEDLQSSGLIDSDVIRSSCRSVGQSEAASVLGYDPGSRGLRIPYFIGAGMSSPR